MKHPSARVKSLRRESDLVDEVQASYLKALKSLDPDFNVDEHLEPQTQLPEAHSSRELKDRKPVDKGSTAHTSVKPASDLTQAGRPLPAIDSDRLSNISDLASPDSISPKHQPTSTSDATSENKVEPTKWLSAVRRVETKSRVSSTDQHEDAIFPLSLGHTGSTAMSLDSLENSEKLRDNDLSKPGPTLHRMDGGVSPLTMGKLPINFGPLESLTTNANAAIVPQDDNAMSTDSLNSAFRKLDDHHQLSLNPRTGNVVEPKEAPEDCSVFKEDTSLSQLNDPQRRSSIRLQSKALLANLIGEDGDSSSGEEMDAALPLRGRPKEFTAAEHPPELKGTSTADDAKQISVQGSFIKAHPLTMADSVMNFDGSDDSLQSEPSPESPIVSVTRANAEDDDVLMGTTQLYVSHDLTEESAPSKESPVLMPKGSQRDGDIASDDGYLEWQSGKADSELKEIGIAIEVCVTAVSFDSDPNRPVYVSVRNL